MDPLAHSLLGAALAESRLGRGRPLAMPTLVLAANVADLDVAAYFWSSDAALAFRRGLTHGPLGLALLPPLVAALVWWIGRARGIASRATGEHRAPRFPPLVGLAYLGGLTHPALDWLNTYGVRFLYPFDRRWFYGDALFIVDPWVWLVLGAGVVLAQRGSRSVMAGWAILAAMAAALLCTTAGSIAGKLAWIAGVAVVAAIRISGRPRSQAARAWVAAAAVGAFVLYLAAAIAAAAAARDLVRVAVDEPVEKLMVGPLPLTAARREVVASTSTEIRYGRFRWLGTPRFEWSGWARPRPPRTPVIEAAMRDPSIRGFLGWARFLYVEVDERPQAWEVHFMDARYTLARNARFGSAVVSVPR
jgi:inner membrane protein